MISVLAFTALKIKEIRELCKIYDVSVTFISGRKIGHSLVPSLFEIDQEKLDNPSLVSAAEFTIRSSPGVKIFWGDIFSPNDAMDKHYTDPLVKSRRWEGETKKFETEFSSCDLIRSCKIKIVHQPTNFDPDKRKKLLKQLEKISEELENYEVTFVHSVIH